MHWAMKCGRSRPNCSATCLAVSASPPPSAAAISKTIFIKIYDAKRQPARHGCRAGCNCLEVRSFGHEEDRKKHNSLGERGAQNGLHQYLRGGAGIASHRFGSPHTDKPHTDSRA